MKDGKLSEVAFKRSVLPVVKRINAEHDSSLCVRTAVVTGNEEGVACLATVRALNAMAAVPADVDTVAITISVPDTFTDHAERFLKGASPDVSENAVKAVMAEVEEALSEKKVSISHISAEITKNTEITVSVIACGRAKALRQPPRKNLVMVGFTAAAGSGMLSSNHKAELRTRYTEDFLASSDKLFDDIDIKEKVENVLAAENYKTYIEPVNDGGVFGALWTLCEALDCGCEVDVKSVPIKQATIEVSEFFDINPYILRGDGAFLYVTDKEAEEITYGVIIGKLTKNADRVIINGETRSFLTPVKEDSYFDVQ